jgi:hypothetical protein
MCMLEKGMMKPIKMNHKFKVYLSSKIKDLNVNAYISTNTINTTED